MLVTVFILSLVLAAFFSGVEMAFVSCNNERFELGNNQGKFSSRVIILFLRNARVFGATLMVGYYLSVTFAAISLLLLFGVPGALYASPLFVLGVATLILFSLFLFADFAAHFLVLNPNRLLTRFSTPLLVIYVLFYPLTQTLAAIWGIPNLFFPSYGEKKRFLNVFIRKTGKQRSHDVQKQFDFQHKQLNELKIFQNALVFSKVRIRDCMVPRTEMESIDIQGSIDDLRKKFVSSGYSKIIVYRNSIDNVEGFIHSKELFRQPATIQEKLTPITFVPETMPANKLLHEFMQHHRSISVVVDEYGGTSGIVTLEDIMEKIFGEIEDEHDTDDLIEKIIKPNEYVLSSRLEIEYLNATFGLKIPETEDYGTLAGYILFHHHNLPKPNETIKIGRFSFKILKVTNTRIDLVYLKVLEI